MAPQPVTSANRRFVVTRLENGVETNVIASTPLPNNYTSTRCYGGRCTTTPASS